MDATADPQDVARRLESDYRESFAVHGGELAVDGRRGTLGVRVDFILDNGARSLYANVHVGPGMWPLRATKRMRALSKAETHLRVTLDGWIEQLKQGEHS